MLYLVLSILGSVFVGVYLKIVKKQNVSIVQMVCVNYIITTLCAYFFFDVDLNTIPQNLPLITIGSLAILLPSIFFAQFFSIQTAGIIKTDIAQRLSLFIPILAAIFLFKEEISNLRYIALAIGLFSIYFILSKPKDLATLELKSSYWPLIVFLGFGIIDVFFKQVALYSEIPYTSTLFYIFGLAFIVSLCFTTGLILRKKSSTKLELKNLLFGIPLGFLNFINIVFYMKAHAKFASSPTTVFAGMNFGVILLGTLIGYFYFKEKMNLKNWIGLAMSILAVLLILLSQLN